MSSYQEDYLKFEPILSAKNLKMIQVQGDGNCLFRSVSVGECGSQEMHRDLRESAVEYLKQNTEEFEMWCEDGVELEI